MEIVLPYDHVLYTTAHEVKQICSPLFSFFGISTFSYLKMYPDLSRIHLDTHPEWSEFFYKNAYRYHLANGLTEGKHWNPGYAILHMLDDVECISDAHGFKIGNGIILSDHIGGCTELSCFVLPLGAPNSKLVGLMNNIDLLQKFIVYFKSMAEKIFLKAEKQKIILPFLKISTERSDFSLSNDTRDDFLRIIQKEQSVLNELTERELECIKYSAKDMSAKQVAKLLCISPRTVEKHLANAKKKLACSRKGALIQMLNEL